MSARRGRSSAGAAVAAPAAAATSPAPRRGRTSAAAAAAAPAVVDHFDFDTQMSDAAEEEEEEAAEVKSASSKKKKVTKASAPAASPKKATATRASPVKQPATASGRKTRKAAEEETKQTAMDTDDDQAAAADEEEEEEDGGEEEKSGLSVHARDSLDAEYSTPLQRPSRFVSSGASGSVQPTKEEQAALLDHNTLRQAMGNKDQLLRTLKKLARVLGVMQQGASAGPLRELAQALIDKQVTKHKSQEIRTMGACCLLDIFRLFAPNLPFGDDKTVKAAFSLFLDQLSHLSEPTHPDYSRHYFLLETMVSVKLCCALTNIDGGEEMLHDFFAMLFALAKHEMTSVVLQHFVTLMGDVLLTYEVVPALLLDEILRHFTPDVMSDNEGGTKLAVQLIHRNTDTLERPIMLWLKGLLVDPTGEESSVDTSILARDDQLSVLAQLSIHANPAVESFQRYAVDLLSDPDDDAREVYTDIYSKVFSSANVSSHNPSVMATNQPLFDTLLARFRDKTGKIRLLISKAAGDILLRQLHNQSNREQLHNLLCDTMVDREESVRTAIIQSVGTAGLAEPEAITSAVISAVVLRGMDKRLSVRQAAVYCLAELFEKHVAHFWRQQTASPKSVNAYLTIPRKLVVNAKLDTHMAVTIDVLLDERVLGTDESIEMRTRSLIGLFISLFDKKSASALTADGEENARPIVEIDRQEARRMFATRILGVKANLHSLVNGLLTTQQDLHAAKSSNSSEKIAKLESQKRQSLILLARAIQFETDGTIEDLVATLHYLIFEAKDKNVHKYLRALSSPLTEYQMIRIAQSSLTSCVKAMTANLPKKKATVSPSAVAARLGTMMSMALLPLESVEMIYREMSSHIVAKRAPLLKSCQELLLLISKTFPLLLTHPGTMEALYSSLTFVIPKKEDDAANITSALEILSAIKDQKAMRANKKMEAKFLGKLTELAMKGTPEHAQLAVQCIQTLWGPEPKSPDASNSKDASMDEESEADRVLAEILANHAESNLTLKSRHLTAALSAAAKIAMVNYPLFQRVSQRQQYFTFLFTELLPSEDLSEHRSTRELAVVLLQNYLVAHGRLHMDALTDDANLTTDEKATSPRSCVSLLLKVVKLDGRFPIASMATAKQLQSIAETEDAETKEDGDARYGFLSQVALALLELATVSVYHRFFTHPPPDALKQYAHRKEERLKAESHSISGILSPKAALTLHKFSCHFLPIAYLAQHNRPEVSQQFLARVLELSRQKRLPYALFAPLFALGYEHSADAVTIKSKLVLMTRRQRAWAEAIENRHAATSAQHQKEAAAAAASAKKKGKGSRKKKASEDDDEEEEEGARPSRVANSAMPEYALADLIYFLSYHPSLGADLGLKPTKEQVNRMHASYDHMLGYLDFFLDCLTQDAAEEGARRFDLLLAILTQIRQHEDVRDPANVKIYKLAELAILSVQQRMAHEKWSQTKYDEVNLSQLMWAPRHTPSKDRYLPADYTLPKHHHATAPAAGGEEEASTPKRKKARSSEGGSAKRRKSSAANGDAMGDSEGEDGSEAPSPRKKKPASASKPKKEPATPSRGRLQRGAKAEVKYTEGEDSDVGMSDSEAVIQTKSTRTPRRPPISDDESSDQEEEEAPTKSARKSSARKSSPVKSPRNGGQQSVSEFFSAIGSGKKAAKK